MLRWLRRLWHSPGQNNWHPTRPPRVCYPMAPARKYAKMLAIALLLAQCAKRVAGPQARPITDSSIGRGFVLNTPLSMHKEPSYDLSIVVEVPVLEEVEILARGVTEANGLSIADGSWVRVRKGPFIGYVVHRKSYSSLAIVTPAVGETALVRGPIQLREKPSNESAIVAPLKKGDVVTVTKHGQINDGLPYSWLGVLTANGITGFVHRDRVILGGLADFLTQAAVTEALALSDVALTERREYSGFAMITADNPHFVDGRKREPTYELTEEQVEGRLVWPPAKGQIVRVKSRATGKGKPYYEIYDEIELGYFYGRVASSTKWIAADEVEFFTDIFKFTKKYNHAVSPALLDFLNDKLWHSDGSGLDARSVTERRIHLRRQPEPGIEYLEVSAKVGVSSSVSTSANGMLFLYLVLKNGRYTVLYGPTDLESTPPVDIDGDGDAEMIISYEFDRGGALGKSVYSLDSKNNFNLILTIGPLGYTIDPPLLIVACNTSSYRSECPADNPNFDEQILHALKLAKGKFTEVALPEKYKKRDAELRSEANAEK